MNLTKGQRKVLRHIKQWYAESVNQPRAAMPLAVQGYAGTGKTYLLSKIPCELDLDNVVFLAFTHKAKNVLAKKLKEAEVEDPYTATIHSSIYKREDPAELERESINDQLENGNLSPKEEKKLRKQLRELPEPLWVLQPYVGKWAYDNEDDRFCFVSCNASLIIVDESSMLTHDMCNDLLQVADCPVIFAGDPAQLPPVKNNGAPDEMFFNTDACEKTPVLKEVLRQEGHVLELATLIRTSPKQKCAAVVHNFPECDDIDIYPSKPLECAMLNGFDFEGDSRIICASNRDRIAINNGLRAAWGYSVTLPPQPGELLTYTAGKLKNTDMIVLSSSVDKYGLLTLKVIDQDGDENTFFARKNLFRNEWYREPDDLWQHLKKSAKYEPDNLPPLTYFDYAYAITCHKAQGSEYDNVIVYPGYLKANNPNQGVSYQSWVYTAVTRARNHVVFADGRLLSEISSSKKLIKKRPRPLDTTNPG